MVRVLAELEVWDPVRRNKVEELIKMMAARVVSRLESLEQETDFDYLVQLSDPKLRNEAIELYHSICQLKEDLQGLT